MRPDAPSPPPPPASGGEFYRPLPIGLVGPEGRLETLEATPEERAALARRFAIPAVGRLFASLRLTAEPDGSILARGRLEAAVTQTCVVTLEPVEQQVAEGVALRFLPPGREPEDGPEDLDEIASAADGTADLGEAIAEQVALMLDPYPRAPGAAMPEEGVSDAASSPFAALAALRPKH